MTLVNKYGGRFDERRTDASMPISFRVGASDANPLAVQFGGDLWPPDLMRLPCYQACVRLLGNHVMLALSVPWRRVLNGNYNRGREAGVSSGAAIEIAMLPALFEYNHYNSERRRIGYFRALGIMAGIDADREQ